MSDPKMCKKKKNTARYIPDYPQPPTVPASPTLPASISTEKELEDPHYDSRTFYRNPPVLRMFFEWNAFNHLFDLRSSSRFCLLAILDFCFPFS